MTRMAKPILFNSGMVRAILNGQKTCTRRIIKPQPKMQLCYVSAGYGAGKWTYPPPHCVEQSGWGKKYKRIEGLTMDDLAQYWTPPYSADDELYVRETWNYGYVETPDFPGYYDAWFEEVDPVHSNGLEGMSRYFYRADEDDEQAMCDIGGRWRPSIFMPKGAARIFLRVMEVGVERLQDINLAGCREEGIWDDYKTDSLRYHDALAEAAYPKVFAELWDEHLKPTDISKYGWESNPWVWVIRFRSLGQWYD